MARLVGAASDRSINLGHLQAPRGDAEAAELETARREFALPTRGAHRPLAAALGEAAWWAGDPAQVVALAQPGYELACEYGVPGWWANRPTDLAGWRR